MKKFVCFATLLFALVAIPVFADHHQKAGILSDAMCGQSLASDMKKAEGHPVSCALKESCAQSGFGIVSDGKFLKFDEAGNTQALEILKNTKKKNNVRVKVTGDFSGDTVKVTKIEEISDSVS